MPSRTPVNKTERALKVQFGAAIRQRRHKFGLSQEVLAKRADMHRTYLADVEAGRRNLALTTIERIADALDLSLADLFQLIEQEPSDLPMRRR